MRTRWIRGLALAGVLVVGAAGTVTPAAGAPGRQGEDPASYWTASRRAAAEPRDLVIDHRGLAYLRAADGRLVPHGHGVAAEHTPLRAEPHARPTNPGGGGGGGGDAGDTTGPTIAHLAPSSGATIGATQSFTATVTDDSGVKSVTFVMTAPSGASYSFSGTRDGDVWGVGLQGFTDGEWSWHVVATDGAKRGGNQATSAPWEFTVDTSPGGGDDGGNDGVVTNAEWTDDSAPVKSAAGRIYFEMPANPKHTRWAGYVCSGTTVTDGTAGRSVILTAAHCVYDDAYKAFARNVLFIPDQAATTGTGTDRNCDNDLYGCWAPSFGVVDEDWAAGTFPDNKAWDYGFYVVADPGHVGDEPRGALDATVGSLGIQWAEPATDSVTHALGYSYADDPNFMYCAEAMEANGTVNWWLPSCGLSGGSSGGPWIQPLADGTGPVISVNSWGYTNSPGMAGPKLSGTSANCLFDSAVNAPLGTDAGTLPDAC